MTVYLRDDAYNIIGASKYYINTIDTVVLEYLHKAVSIQEQLMEDGQIYICRDYAITHHYIGQFYKNATEYDKATEYALKAINIIEESQHSSTSEYQLELIRASTGLMSIYSANRQYDKSINLYKKIVGLEPKFKNILDNNSCTIEKLFKFSTHNCLSISAMNAR